MVQQRREERIPCKRSSKGQEQMNWKGKKKEKHVLDSKSFPPLFVMSLVKHI